MLNLIAAIIINALVALASTTNYLKGPLVMGAIGLGFITSLSTKAQAAVGYKDPIVERFGEHYTSLEVLQYYGYTWGHAMILVCIIVILVAVLFKIAPRSQWSARNW